MFLLETQRVGRTVTKYRLADIVATTSYSYVLLVESACVVLVTDGTTTKAKTTITTTTTTTVLLVALGSCVY